MRADAGEVDHRPAASALTLRRASNADRDAVVRLHVEGLEQVGVSHDPKLDSDLEDIEGAYTSRGGEFIVAVQGDAIIGMAAFRKLDGRNVELRRLRVSASERRKGHGRNLVRELVQEATSRGFKSMVLDASAEMEEARALFESEGFELERENDFFGMQVFFYRKQLT